MEVKIGMVHIPREIVIEVDESPEDLSESFQAALISGTPWHLTDAKGRQVLISPSKVGYVDLGSTSTRAVGFGAV